jgi:hypothetical protein
MCRLSWKQVRHEGLLQRLLPAFFALHLRPAFMTQTTGSIRPGVAPITKRSGKTRIVLMRQAVHVRLHNSAYHWARVAVQHDPRSRAKYAALRARGHGHGRALRSVADRLQAVACTMLIEQKAFDPALAAHVA